MSARTRRSLSSGEWILLAAVCAEIAVFAAIAQNFFTLENFFEILRLSVELGLLAVALTPVIVSGGIDLSVGSMMGLAAVLFGAAYRDWGLSVGGAAMVALVAGCPDWSRAWPPSFTWRISARRNRMRDPATSWTRSPPLSLAGRPCSAGAGRCGAPCSVSRHSRCCGTDCTWRPCHQN